jgi:hypothetical protein
MEVGTRVRTKPGVGWIDENDQHQSEKEGAIIDPDSDDLIFDHEVLVRIDGSNEELYFDEDELDLI